MAHQHVHNEKGRVTINQYAKKYMGYILKDG
jgi:hypothetical protein